MTRPQQLSSSKSSIYWGPRAAISGDRRVPTTITTPGSDDPTGMSAAIEGPGNNKAARSRRPSQTAQVTAAAAPHCSTSRSSSATASRRSSATARIPSEAIQVLAQEGDLISRGALEARILNKASASDFAPLGLGTSAVETDNELPTSAATGQGGELRETAERLIDEANKPAYRARFTRRLAENKARRRRLPISPRPAPIGPHCARGLATICESPLKFEAIAADVRGHAIFGILPWFVKYGWPTRSRLPRGFSVSPVTPTFKARPREVAKAQAKDIAAGFVVVVGTPSECATRMQGLCDCSPGLAFNAAGTGAVDKRDPDTGKLEGVRIIHAATAVNKGTDSLDYCICDGVDVGVQKALDARAEYRRRGWTDDEIVLLAEKRDWKNAYKHNAIETCCLFMMGVRIVLLMCLRCGLRRSEYEDNECICSSKGATTTEETFGYYAASSFGTRASAFNFGLLGNAFKWSMQSILGVTLMSLYVDDSFTVGVAHRAADGSISEDGVDIEHRISWGSYAWTENSTRWGLAESSKKRIVGSSVLNLGVVVDLLRMEIRLLPRKIAELKALLVVWKTRTSSTKLELQSLRGVFGWAINVVRGGKVVLGLFDAAIRQHAVGASRRKRILPGTRRAVTWLQEIFTRHSGTKLILTSDWISSAVLHLATDASGGADGGFGGYHGMSYFAGKFPSGLTSLYTIAELELTTVIVGLLAFGAQLRGRRIIMACDNSNANGVARKGSVRSSLLQYLAMALHKVADTLGIDVRIRWIASKDNFLADLASRNRAAFVAYVNSLGAGTPREIPVDPAVFPAIFGGYTGANWTWDWTSTDLVRAASA